MKNSPKDRVGMFVDPHTRDRLNKFVADHRLVTGEYISQSKAVEILLDHYRATSPQLSARAAEFA